MIPDGNFQSHRNMPKLSNIDIVTLAVLAVTLVLDSENLSFLRLNRCMPLFVNLPDRLSFDHRDADLNIK
jgi:hypothetical protein